MPELAPQVRQQGGHKPSGAELWPDHDWSVPTDLDTLRHRVLEAPDQSRYGRAKDGPR